MMQQMDRRLFVRNKKDWEKLGSQNYFSDKKLKVTTVKNAIALPAKPLNNSKKQYCGGICNQDFQFIAGLLRVNEKDPGWYGMGSSYSVPKEQLQYCNETVVFGGVLLGHFGHFILENMSRLWWWVKNRNCNYKFVFITIWPRKSWFADFFTLLGMDLEKIVYIETPTQFKEMIIPEESIHSWKEYTKEYLMPYQFIRQNINLSLIEPISKIYFTRSAFEKQDLCNCLNEKYFEQFYQERGYAVIAPETLPISKQIALVANADEIVATLGTLSHLAIFAKPHTKLTSLTRTHHQVLLPQCLIHQAAEVDWYLVDVSMNYLLCDRVQGVNLLGTSDCWKNYVQDHLKEVWNEQNNTPPKAFYDYLLEWIRYYSDPQKYSRIENWKTFDMLNQMNQILLGRTLDKKQFPVKDLDLQLTQAKKLLQEEKQYYFQTKKASVKKDQNVKKWISSYLQMISQLVDFPKEIRDYNDLCDQTMCQFNKPSVSYSVHVSHIGWISPVEEGEICGAKEKDRNIEAICIQRTDFSENLTYAAYVKDMGWTDWKPNQEYVGTVGKSLPIQSIKIQFPQPEENYQISYRVFHQEFGWSEWCCNGNPTDTLHYPSLQNIQIKVEEITEQFQTTQSALEQAVTEQVASIDCMCKENKQLTINNEFLQGKISVYLEEIKEYETNLQNQRREVHTLLSEKISLQKEQKQLLAQIQQLTEQNHQLVEEKEHMTHSLSWRITKFLR